MLLICSQVVQFPVLCLCLLCISWADYGTPESNSISHVSKTSCQATVAELWFPTVSAVHPWDLLCCVPSGLLHVSLV